MKIFVLKMLAPSVVLFLSATSFADPMYGVLMVVKGSVKIQSAGKSTDAKVGAKVVEGDTVNTAADSRAKIVMSDRNVINVNPDTQVAIAKYENDAATGKKNVELNLLKGKVRNNVEQTYDGEKNKFLIKTPTAVAGVRGTQFLAGFDAATKTTSVVTFKGAVTLASVNAQGAVIGTPVVINKGEMTQASPNAAPAAPKAVPKEEMKKMDNESTASTSSDKKREVASEAKDGKEKKEGSDKKEGTDKKESSTSKEAPPESVGSAPPPPPPPPAMIDSRDMDTGLAKDIKDVRAPATAPAPVMPPPPLATPNPIVNQIIRDSGGKTRVNVKPVAP